jgi:hypothetical protein
VNNKFSLVMPEKYYEAEKLELFLNKLYDLLDGYEKAAAEAALRYFKEKNNRQLDNDSMRFLNEQAGQKTAQLKSAEEIIGEVNKIIRQYWPAPSEQLAAKPR